MAANTPQQGQAPNLSSFGLVRGGKDFPTEGREQSQPAGRTVSVSKRGPGQAKGAAQELDSASESEPGASHDASGEGEGQESEAELEAEAEGSEEADGGELEAEGSKEEGKEKSDSRSRKQLRAALAKQAAQHAEEMAALQRRQDAVEARQTQATQTQAARAEGEGEDADELDKILDDGKPGTELLSKDDLKTRGDRKKKLESYVGKQAGRHVQDFANRELAALYAMPGAKEIVEWGQKTGALAKVSTEHQFTAPKVMALLTAKHAADVAQKDKTIASLKEQVRRLNLGEIPPSGQGSRGGRGTGQGDNNGRSANPTIKGWDALKARIHSS